MNVAVVASYSSVLLLNLSDNLLEQSRNNIVVVQQEEMDLVGFELPTTSANSIARRLCGLISLFILGRMSSVEDRLVRHRSPSLFLYHITNLFRRLPRLAFQMGLTGFFEIIAMGHSIAA
jgi:hypothetical protein